MPGRRIEVRRLPGGRRPRMQAIEEFRTLACYHIWLPPAPSSLVKHENGTVGDSILYFRFSAPLDAGHFSYCELLLYLPLYNSCCENMFFNTSEGHGMGCFSW